MMKLNEEDGADADSNDALEVKFSVIRLATRPASLYCEPYQQFNPF